MPATTTAPPPVMDRPLVTLDAEALAMVADIVTSTDEPVEGRLADAQMGLFRDILLNSWKPVGPHGPRQFYVCANVGIFEHPGARAVVPDVAVKLDAVPPAGDGSYYLWEMGAPTVVVEIVSDRRGQELDEKMATYARWGVPYYVVTDPRGSVGSAPLRVFELDGDTYREVPGGFMERIGLGLALWNGVYSECEHTFVRWVDREGRLLGTGAENTAEEVEFRRRETARADAQAARAETQAARAEAEAAFRREESRRAAEEAARADQAEARAAEAEARAKEEALRAQRLAARLRALGVPDQED